MAALQVIEATIWRDTLASFAAVQALVPLQDAPAQYKIYWEHVEDTVELPYITTHHISGGILADPRYADTTWKIVGHTADMDTAVALANAISGLANADPVILDPLLCAYDWIREMMPVFDRYQAQNVPYFVVGGLFRLRLKLPDN